VEIRDRYVALFETAIDRALSGEPQMIAFCKDIVLELYLEDGKLHWRRVDGSRTGNERGNG
jgi:hypothetical protein